MADGLGLRQIETEKLADVRVRLVHATIVATYA